jgi:hypothetical protein
MGSIFSFAVCSVYYMQYMALTNTLLIELEDATPLMAKPTTIDDPEPVPSTLHSHNTFTRRPY